MLQQMDIRHLADLPLACVQGTWKGDSVKSNMPGNPSGRLSSSPFTVITPLNLTFMIDSSAGACRQIFLFFDDVDDPDAEDDVPDAEVSDEDVDADDDVDTMVSMSTTPMPMMIDGDVDAEVDGH